MIKRVIYTFLAVQIASFAIWQGTALSQKSASADEIPIVRHEAAETISHVSFRARSEEKSLFSLDTVKKNEIMNVLSKLPAKHLSVLRNIILDFSPEAHRGLGGKNLIILRAVNMDAEEFFAVLIHEIGHSVDLGYLTGSTEDRESLFFDNSKPVYASDPSVGFYQISWKDSGTMKKDAENMDFVSGYAMSDPFEDFAESYVYYILHNKDFKSKAQTGGKLMRKYQFMKDAVFGGIVFDTGSDTLTDSLKIRPWDITLLDYDLNSFLTGRSV